jgi:hypothetical protein
MRLLVEVCLMLLKNILFLSPRRCKGTHHEETSSSIPATLIGIGSIDGEFIVSWTPNPNRVGTSACVQQRTLGRFHHIPPIHQTIHT